MNEKAKLMNRIQVCAFNLDELTLFLDTHPDCKEAKDLFLKYKGMMIEASEAYNKNYGPLSAFDYSGGEWKWINSPWPWELSEV